MEKRLHSLYHHDANDAHMNECGPGYSYKDVQLRATPLREFPQLQSVSARLAKDLGVSKWEISMDTVVYVDGLDHIGWHSDSDQGATTVATIILDAAGQLSGKYSVPSWTNPESSLGIDGVVTYPVIAQRLVEKSFGNALSAIPQCITLLPCPAFKDLSNVKLNLFLPPNQSLFKIAHRALSELIPKEDMEHYKSSWAAQELAKFWRPNKPKVIFLWESHSSTPHDLMGRGGPRMRDDVLPQYSGPRNALAHVSNLFYGENECGTKSLALNSGSSHFWKLLGTLAYGYNRWISNNMYRDVQKPHNKSCEARLDIKYEVLLALKRKGFWLVETMVFRWYLQQPVE